MAFLVTTRVQYANIRIDNFDKPFLLGTRMGSEGVDPQEFTPISCGVDAYVLNCIYIMMLPEIGHDMFPQQIKLLAAMTCLALSSLTGDATAAKLKATVEPLDASKPLAEIMKNSPGNCQVIYQDGKPYKVCPYRVPFEIKGLIDKQMVR